jgi:hypothetical protein
VPRDASERSSFQRAVSPVEWLLLAAGVYLTVHYAWLMDDAFIYFRYVDNLLHRGLGLVWNGGELVEGYSSPLWALLLIGMRATGLDFWVVVQVLGALSFLAFWAGLVRLRGSMAPDAPAVGLPLAYAGFLYGVLCYFTSGLETPLVQVAAVLFALLVVSPRSVPLQVLVGATPLLRHELALPFLLAVAWVWWRERRAPRALVLSGVGITGAWLAFRVVYYADLFQNTFYLKDAVAWGQGWRYLLDATTTYWLGTFLLVHVALFVFLARRGRGREELLLAERGVMVLMALSIAVYVVKIGGDPRHYRYLAFPIVLVVCACSGLAERALASAPSAPRGIAPVLAVALALGAACRYPRQLNEHPIGLAAWSHMEDGIHDAAWHRTNEELRQRPWHAGSGLVSAAEYRAFAEEHPGADHLRVSRHQRCVRMYRRFDVRYVHALGLTDPILARTRLPADRPAHKQGLVVLSDELRRLLAAAGGRPAVGLHRAAVERGDAPGWIERNLETIEVVERKSLNTHRLLENLRLAFTFPAPIEVE